MDEDYWWWAVYDMQRDEITIQIAIQKGLLAEIFQGLKQKVLP